MAQLKNARMTNDDFISSVDNGLGAAEAAVGAIFGIPMNTDINNPIFGAEVNAAGELQGLMKWRNTTGLTSGASFIDDTNDSEFRLVASGDELKLYRYNPVGQNPVFKRSLSLEQTFNNLTDNHLGTAGTNKFSGKGGKIIAVKLTEDGLEAITPSSGGALSFLDLTDVDNYTGYPNYFLRVREVGGVGVGIEYAQVASGGVENYIELLDTPGSFTNDWEGAVRISSETAFGLGYKVSHARFYGGQGKYLADQVLNDGTGSMYLNWGSAFREWKSGELTDIFGGTQINLPYDPYSTAIYSVSGFLKIDRNTLNNAWFNLNLEATNMPDSNPCAVWAQNVCRDTTITGPTMFPFNFLVCIPYGTTYWATLKLKIQRMDATFNQTITSGAALTVTQARTSVFRVK